MSPLVTLPHILLVLAGAFLIGVRAYAETHPQSPGADAGNEDSQQLLKLAKYASLGLVLLMVLVVVGLDLNSLHVAKVIR